MALLWGCGFIFVEYYEEYLPYKIAVVSVKYKILKISPPFANDFLVSVISSHTLILLWLEPSGVEWIAITHLCSLTMAAVNPPKKYVLWVDKNTNSFTTWNALKTYLASFSTHIFCICGFNQWQITCVSRKPLNYIELYRYFPYFSLTMQHKDYLHRIFIEANIIMNTGRI